ncbi:unnamed protein product [Effrenium voratum]|nr:unnamed protein product [Effrenium voratum]
MVWELPPRRSWVASTPAPKAPAYYVAPAPPWVPAGSRPLSRPSSARSKSRPQSACSSRPPSAGYAARSAFSEMRPSSPARPRPPPRPSSAPQLKAHGRKYRPSERQRPLSAVEPRANERVSRVSSKESLAAPNSRLTIYTDHGSSDSENEAPNVSSFVQYAPGSSSRSRLPSAKKPREEPARDDQSAETPTEAGDTESEKPTLEEELAAMAAWERSLSRGTCVRRRQVCLCVLRLHGLDSFVELAAELALGGKTQCTSTASVARWPRMPLGFEIDLDLPTATGMCRLVSADMTPWKLPSLICAFHAWSRARHAEDRLQVQLWTGEHPRRRVASGSMDLQMGSEKQKVQMPLTVDSGGFAHLELEVGGEQQPHIAIIGDGDAICSRSQSLFRRIKRPRKEKDEEAAAEDIDQAYQAQRPYDVDSRCWSYLEHRFEALKLKRSQQRSRVAAARKLRAPPAVDEKPRMQRVHSEQAIRLQRYLRPMVRGDLAARTPEHSVFQAEELSGFISELCPSLPEGDATALQALLLGQADGQAQFQALLDFAEQGLSVVPPPRIIYPDELRARKILQENFPTFLHREEQQREMQMSAVM